MEDKEKPKITIADIADNAQEPAQNQSAPSSAEDGQGYVFYNVMPKAKEAGSMTQPTLKVEQVPAPSAGAIAPSFFSKYKFYILGFVAIAVLGPLIYYLATNLGASSYKSQDIVVKQPSGQAVKGSSTPVSSSQAGFTTSLEWRNKYFASCSDPNECGDNADPDKDGLSNLQEFKLGTDPNNPDSDQDGISDGDELNIFGTDPLKIRTANDPQYTDADYIKGGYDIGTGKKMTQQQIAAISAKMKNFGLHEPTVTTLGLIVNSLYNFSALNSSSTASSSLPSSSLDQALPSAASSTLDQSLAAKQDRDTQRSSAIKNVEIALVKYYSDNQTYPQTNDFGTMFATVKPYLKVATNPIDPVNSQPYVYTYVSADNGTNFSLGFYSEVANAAIIKNAAEAQKDAASQEASLLDNQRQTDLENIRTALLLYSQNNVAGNQTYVFPSVDKYKTALVPDYLEAVPKDPKTGQDYPYQVSTSFNTFTLKAVFDSPPAGTTGYLCNQEECMNY